MTDFFLHQEKARRRTGRLVLIFILGVALMVLTVYLVFAGVFLHDKFQRIGPRGLWNLQLFASTSLGTLAIIGFASLYKTIELGQGGSVVATSLGGVPVDPHTHDPDLRKLLNVVEEMSIASGVPMPEVYVMPEEKGINAFAAGTKPDNAVVAVTDGCIRNLNRDELQGVIAHEFSHIFNGDMRLNMRLIGLIFGLICIMLIGRVLLEGFWNGSSRRRRSSDKDGGNPLPFILIAVALLIIGWLGAFFGQLIQAAVSRQREFLADASAVQFTRNPLGLAGALKKIGGLAEGSKLSSPHAGEASHLFFSNGMRESWLGLTATHPPLDERIRRLDPSFDGQFSTVVSEMEPDFDQLDYRQARLSPAPPIAPPPQLQAALGLQAAAGLATKPLPARDAVRQFTAPTPQHLEFAAHFRAGLSASIATAAHDPLGATALTYGLLLPSDPAARLPALDAARALIDAPAYLELTRLDADLAALDPAFKLPLALLAMPALRQMAPAQFLQFEKTLDDLIRADQQIDLFEFTLRKIVVRHLDSHFKPSKPVVAQYYALNRLLDECEVLLSALAHVGQQAPSEIQNAFRRGAAQLKEGAHLALKPLGECSLTDIDGALDRLNLASPPVKKELLNACAHVVAADANIAWREAELLRAIADTLDCPVPPFIAGV